MRANLFLLLGSLLLALVLAAGLYLLLRPAPFDYPDYRTLVAFDPGRKGGHLLPNRDLLVQGEKVGQGVRWVTDRHGFRNREDVHDEPPPGTYRILFYGDSFVDGLRTDQERTIGFQLQQRLTAQLPEISGFKHVQVLISGHNNPADAWFHFQEHGHRFHPHLVILGVTLGNDITWNSYGTRVVPVMETMERLVAYRPEPDMSLERLAYLPLPADAYVPARPLRDALDDQWLGVKRFLARHSRLFAQTVPPRMGPRVNRRHGVLSAGFFVSLGLFDLDPQPLMQRLLLDTEEVFRGMDRQVRSYGARFLVVWFPVRAQVHAQDWSRLVRHYSLAENHFDLEQPNRRLWAFCLMERIDCLDPLTAFRSHAEQYGESLYRPRGDMHFNDAGQALAARTLADWLLSREMDGQLRALAPVRPVPADELERLREHHQSWVEKTSALTWPYLLVQEVPVTAGADENPALFQEMLESGWSWRHTPAVWSLDKHAVLRLPAVPRESLTLTLTLKPKLHQGKLTEQRVRVRHRGSTLAEWHLDREVFQDRTVRVPVPANADATFTIQLELPDARTRAELGLGPDRRELGIAVRAIRLE